MLRERMLASHIHRKKPADRAMPTRTARATTKIGLANLVHNMRRLISLERQAVPG